MSLLRASAASRDGRATHHLRSLAAEMSHADGRTANLRSLADDVHVHPDVAVARKTTESETSVRPRSQEVWQTDWEAQGATVIDASVGADEVAKRAVAVIWQAL